MKLGRRYSYQDMEEMVYLLLNKLRIIGKFKTDQLFVRTFGAQLHTGDVCTRVNS